MKQAGLRETLIDQNGNTLYYSIEVNPAFADFIKQNGLTTSKAIQAYSALEANPNTRKGLSLPAVESPSSRPAWQLVEGDQAATIDAATQNYISFKTTIPTLRQTTDANGNKQILEDRTVPITATVRLLAIHVVYTLPGHPEFIWASFEHTTGAPDSGAADGHRDLAPTFDGDNPKDADMTNHLVTTPAATAGNYILYKDNTAVNASNASISENSLNLVGQKFMDPSGGPQSTSIYRMFPASKSNTTTPDDAVTSLNHNVEAIFIKATASNALPGYDKRGYYRLVGAQWMDQPRFFHNDFPIQNDETNPYAQSPAPTRTSRRAASASVSRSSPTPSGTTAPTARTRSSPARTACRASRWSRSRRRRVTSTTASPATTTNRSTPTAFRRSASPPA